MLKKIIQLVMVGIFAAVFVAAFALKDTMNNTISELMKQQASPDLTSSGEAYIDSLYNYTRNGDIYKITFLEFGAKGCSACKRMESVMEEIRSKYHTGKYGVPECIKARKPKPDVILWCSRYSNTNFVREGRQRVFPAYQILFFLRIRNKIQRPIKKILNIFCNSKLMPYICKQLLTYMKKQSTEIRQEQIKQAELDIIYTDGLKNLSTRNLAKRIGMSEGSIFRHFASKQDITLSIIRDVQTDFIGSLRSIANSNALPEERLNQFLCQTVTYLTRNKGITMLLFSEVSYNNDAALKVNLLQIFNNQKKLVSKIILDGIALGIWDEGIHVENVAMLYMAIPVSLNIELVLNGGEFHIDNFCTHIMQLMLKMLIK